MKISLGKSILICAFIAFFTAGCDSSSVESPSIPSNLTSSYAGGVATLSWEASTGDSGISGYKIYRNGSMIGEANITSYSDKTITAPGKYSYSLSASDTAGNESPQSPEIWLNVPADENGDPSQAGKIMWKYETGIKLMPSPAVYSDGTIYAADVNGVIYAINTDGTLKWKYGYAKEGDNPQIALGKTGVLYVAANSGLFAINPDGSLKWKNSEVGAGEKTMAIGGGDTLYVVMYSDLYAISDEGSLKWQNVRARYAPAVTQDGSILSGGFSFKPDGSSQDAFYGEAFTFTMQGGYTVINGYSFGVDGTFYISSVDYKFGQPVHENIIAKNPDYSTRWSIQLPTPSSLPKYKYITASVLGPDSTSYMISSDGYLNAVSGSGEMKWRKEVGNCANPPTIGSDVNMYIQSDSALFALDSSGNEIWKNMKLSGDSCPAMEKDGSIIVVSGNAIYAVKSDSHGLASNCWPRKLGDNYNSSSGLIQEAN